MIFCWNIFSENSNQHILAPGKQSLNISGGRWPCEVRSSTLSECVGWSAAQSPGGSEECLRITSWQNVLWCRRHRQTKHRVPGVISISFWQSKKQVTVEPACHLKHITAKPNMQSHVYSQRKLWPKPGLWSWNLIPTSCRLAERLQGRTLRLNCKDQFTKPKPYVEHNCTSLPGVNITKK